VHSHLIQTSELALHLDDPDWAVIDARFYLAEPARGEGEFLEGHVPGALYAHLDRDLSGPLTGGNGRHPMPSVEQMTDRFSRWGIDDDVQVAVYDTLHGQMASRLWWMLRYLGHDAVAVVDGGFTAWRAEKRPVASGRETRPRRAFVPRVREEMRIDIHALEGATADVLLVDARAPERFRGETEPLDPVAGHIPGARNHPTSSSLGPDGRFLPVDVLRETFETILGETPPSAVVSYCGSGVTACHNLLAMEIAGIRGVRLYPGSWSEWCADVRRPIETGEGGKG
jgi:thiosulfate/3-mercaptopyruvate sulfurtransferase